MAAEHARQNTPAALAGLSIEEIGRCDGYGR
jgi:hypothetical protein